MRKQHVRVAAAIAVLAIAAAACGSDKKTATTTTTAAGAGASSTTSGGGGGNDRGNVDGTLTIGALMPQSGDLSVIYKALHVPTMMAIDEINAAGGVNGKPVVLKDADDGTSADVASTSLDTLLGEKVDAIVGPASSGTALGIIGKIKTAGVVDCSGSNTSAALSTADDGGYYFRTAPPDKFQGPALAQLVIGDGHKKVAIAVRNDSYGTGFGSALKDALTNGGATVTINQAYDPKASDFSAEVTAVKNSAPDAVILIGFNDDGGKYLKEMIAQGIGPDKMAIYTADGMQSSSLYKSVDASKPSVVNGIKGTAPAAAPDGVDSPFIAKYKATGNDTIFSGYYYDCTILIALAADAAKSDDPAKIKDKMIEVSKGGEKCNTYKSCLDLLNAGKNIDYQGASGPVDLTDVGEPANGVYDVWAYGPDGKYSNVKGAPQIKIGA